MLNPSFGNHLRTQKKTTKIATDKLIGRGLSSSSLPFTKTCAQLAKLPQASRLVSLWFSGQGEAWYFVD
jgi:hypothetical protein